MKTIEQIKDILEHNEIQISNYYEDGKLCGYELNTYTGAGVNEIIFLDFRDDGKDATNSEHFISEFQQYMKDYTIDDRIEKNRQNKEYRDDFTISKSLKDFKKYYKNINLIIEKLKN